MKLEFGHWIVMNQGKLIAKAYNPSLFQGEIDMQLNGDVIVVIKGGCDRYTVRLKNLQQAIQVVESIPEEYVREVFVARRQDENLTFAEGPSGRGLIMPLAITARILTRR